MDSSALCKSFCDPLGQVTAGTRWQSVKLYRPYSCVVMADNARLEGS